MTLNPLPPLQDRPFFKILANFLHDFSSKVERMLALQSGQWAMQEVEEKG